MCLQANAQLMQGRTEDNKKTGLRKAEYNILKQHADAQAEKLDRAQFLFDQLSKAKDDLSIQETETSTALNRQLKATAEWREHSAALEHDVAKLQRTAKNTNDGHATDIEVLQAELPQYKARSDRALAEPEKKVVELGFEVGKAKSNWARADAERVRVEGQVHNEMIAYLTHRDQNLAARQALSEANATILSF